jgi:predicted Fe-Mo cluster-binding NifX family protein
MRFAVATDDGTRVARHTGRCGGFAVFEVVNQNPVRVEFRPNTFTAHAAGQCAGPGGAGHDHGHSSHGDLIEALRDCRALVTRGLGPRLVADLAARQIEPYLCDCEAVDEAAALFVRGQLPRAGSSGCGCPG